MNTAGMLPTYLTLEQFSHHSGLSESTIRRRARDGSLPVVQIGGKGKRLLFPPGGQVLLHNGWDYMNSKGPLAVESRPCRKRYFICTSGLSRVRIQYAAIDWPKTAEINGITVPGPVLVNRIGPILEATTV